MTNIGKAEAALLGLVLEGEAHAYQIEKQVEFRDMRYWTELSMSSIYKVMKKLEGKKLVSSRNEITEGNKMRKVYSVTALGRKTMQEKILDMFTRPEHTRWAVDVATYNIDVLSRRDRLAALKKYQAVLQEQIKGYHALDDFLVREGCPAHRRAVAKRPVYLLKGELKWLEAYMKEIA